MFKSKFDLFLSTFCGFVHTEQAGRYHMRPTKKRPQHCFQMLLCQHSCAPLAMGSGASSAQQGAH